MKGCWRPPSAPALPTSSAGPVTSTDSVGQALPSGTRLCRACRSRRPAGTGGKGHEGRARQGCPWGRLAARDGMGSDGRHGPGGGAARREEQAAGGSAEGGAAAGGGSGLRAPRSVRPRARAARPQVPPRLCRRRRGQTTSRAPDTGRTRRRPGSAPSAEAMDALAWLLAPLLLLCAQQHRGTR